MELIKGWELYQNPVSKYLSNIASLMHWAVVITCLFSQDILHRVLLGSHRQRGVEVSRVQVQP